MGWRVKYNQLFKLQYIQVQNFQIQQSLTKFKVQIQTSSTKVIVQIWKFNQINWKLKKKLYKNYLNKNKKDKRIDELTSEPVYLPEHNQ